MPKNRKPKKVKGEIQKLFSIDWDDTTQASLILTSCDELNDASWGAWFGEIQNILKFGCYEDHKFTRCHVDLSYCLWGDPLPLLSLALTLNEYELTDGNVTITLPTSPSNFQILTANTFLTDFKRKRPYSNSELIDILKALLYEEQIKGFKNPNLEAYSNTEFTSLKKDLKNQSEEIVKKARFLKYLYREGFLTLFTKGNIVNFSSEVGRSNPRICLAGDSVFTSLPASLSELPVSLAFERSTCIVATILKLDTSDIQETFKKLDNWVEQQLHKSISQVVYEEMPSWAQGDLQYRLIILLRETLHNIAEHAYIDKNNGFAAVYVRYREGALGEDSTTWGRLEEFTKRETDSQKTPLLHTKKIDSFSNTRSGFFEVFVLDSGQGLFNSLNKASTEDTQNNLHQAMLDVFIRNNTSKGESRSTEHGGLYLLKKLLSPHQDYFRVRDDGTWWGTPVHLFDENTRSNHITLHAYGKKFGNNEIVGLAWTARLSWLDAQDYSGQAQLWKAVENDKIDEQAPFRKLFKDTEYSSLFSKGVVIQDSRFSPFHPDLYQNDKEASEFLFLPRPLLMKNIIQDEIKRFLIQFEKCTIKKFVIGDVPSEEAITYLAAIVRANKFLNPPFSQLERIIIITRELRVCVLTRTTKFNLFEVNTLEGDSFFVENLPIPTIDNNITNFLRVLRRHDSHRIKEIITKSSSSINADFIKEEVEWSDGLILEGYLDFPQSLTHPLCREIYSLSLKRLTGLSINGCRLESLDSLVDSLVTRFNALIHPRQLKKVDNLDTIIQVGSIRVTGYTEESEHQENKSVFHFFQHPSGKAKGAFLLPWIGSSEDIVKIEDISRPYMRVGKTPVIARGGWKSYEIPRFDQNNQCIYERTPKDSYQAWQDSSRSPMKLGHWVYGGHHEIFTVNLLLAFNSELEHIGSSNSLAKFVYANFFRVFNIKEKNLNQPSKALLVDIKEAQFKHLLPELLAEQSPLLVYPSHPVTDHIVNEFLALLEENSLSMIRDNLIAILPVRCHRSGSGLQVSGITLERLKNAIDSEKKRPVVYFDDGVISGRTFVEIKRLLRGMGYGLIYSVVLLDRQRLPSVHYLGDDNKHVGYWRLDAPSMGGKAHCPLCHAIDKIIAIEDSIVSEVHKQRMKEWCDTWKELDPSTQWGSQGLRPIPLSLKNPNPRFCLRYNPKTKEYEGIGEEKEQEILLTNSAGLIAWVTELHTVTSRDDFSLSLIEKESENLSGEVRIQLLASQLLLFSAEFDTKQAETLALALIKELWNLPRHDRHSALASLVLVSCVNDPFALVKKFLDLENRWPELKEKNIDFILFTATALISSNVSYEQISELEKNEFFEIISRLLKPNGKPDLYYRLHREAWDVLGKAHSSPLQRFVSDRNTIISQTEKTLINTLASASQIRTIAINIFEHHWHWLRAETKSPEDYSSIIDEIKKNADSLHNCINHLLELLPTIKLSIKNSSSADTKITSKFIDAQKKGNELLEISKKLHNGLFTSLGIQTIKDGVISFPFVNTIQGFIDCENEFEKKGESRIIKWHQLGKNETKRLFTSLDKPELEEAFVVWDEEIKEAVRDVFSNVQRIDEKIINPWKTMTDNNKAHFWCRIQLSELGAKIEIKNKTSDTAEVIKNKTKNSHSHSIIKDIGGNVSYSNENDDFLLTIILLPYAHTLQIQSKGEVK